MNNILSQSLDQSISYAEYRQLLDHLFEEGKTTGPNQSETFIKYAGLNLRRMQRLEKRGQLSGELEDFLAQLDRSYIFLTITEGWCGDAAQSLPLIDMIAEASHKISHRVVLRDEHTQLIDLYLTDGGRSIPKVIILDADSGEELATWGPRPREIQELALAHKHAPEPKASKEDFAKELHGWYAKDKTRSLQAEFLDLLKNLEKNKAIH